MPTHPLSVVYATERNVTGPQAARSAGAIDRSRPLLLTALQRFPVIF
jgi:hypothetical protein